VKPHNYKRGVFFPLDDRCFSTEKECLEAAKHGKIILTSSDDECLVAAHYLGQVWVLDSFNIRKAMIEKYTTTEGKPMKDKRTKADLLQEIEGYKARCRNYDVRLIERLDQVEKLEHKVQKLESEKFMVIDENHELTGQVQALHDSMEIVLKAQTRTGPFNDDLRKVAVPSDYAERIRAKL
jgi:hypothetical protein